MKKLFSALILLSFLSCCSTDGNINITDQAKVASIKIGISTKKDVINTFGNIAEVEYPSSVDSANMKMTYSYQRRNLFYKKIAKVRFNIENNIVTGVSYSDITNPAWSKEY